MHGVPKSRPQRVRSSGSCLGEAGTVPLACHNEAKMLPTEHEGMGAPAERASTAAGGGRGGCIAAWEVGHVEDEHEGSVENFGG